MANGDRSAGDRTRYWNAVLPGVSCLHATFTSQHFAPHSHDALVIVVTEGGASTYTSRGVTAHATPTQLLVFNPVEPHAGHMRDTRYWQYRGLYLADAALVSLLPALGIARLPGFTRNAFSDHRLIDAFMRLHRELDGGDPGLARERLIDACGRLFSTYSKDAPREPDATADRTHVNRALETIRARFREPLTIDELAVSVGLSPFQLIRQFKRSTGMPPHAHLVRARLHHAIRQMRDGVCLAEAAGSSGFYDQSALTRHFRRNYGITPGQYVRAAQFSPRPAAASRRILERDADCVHRRRTRRDDARVGDAPRGPAHRLHLQPRPSSR